MRSLARQGRVFWAIMYLFISWITFILLFTAVYFPAISVRTGIMGFNVHPYSGESETRQIKTHSLIIVKKATPKTLEPGAIFSFLTNEDGALTYNTRIFSSYTESSGGKITVNSLDIKDGSTSSDQILKNDIIGAYIVALPFIGASTRFLTQSSLFIWSGIILFMFLLVILPIFIVIRSVRKFRRKSPFPDGLDISKFNTHNLFIYEQLIEFFLEGGLKIVKGFDCDKIFIGDNIYFANIAYINKCIYVNINKSLRRYDGAVDRSGAIPILTPHDLDEAKDRIMAFYKAYFKPLRKIEEKRKN